MCNNPLHEPLLDARERARVVAASKGQCVKCKSSRATLLLRQAAFCKDCFLDAFMANFRGAVGRQRNGPSSQSERILVEFDASPASKALLWACQFSLKNDPLRRNNGLFTAVYVENPAHSAEHQTKITAAVKSYLSGAGIPLIVVEAGVFNTASEKHLVPRQKHHTQEALEDVFFHLKRKKIFEVASAHCFSKIYSPQTSTDIAIKTIEFTAKGRGFMLPLEVGGPFSQNSNGNFEPASGADDCDSPMYLRPLIAHSTKEAVLFCHFQGLLNDDTSLLDENILCENPLNQNFTSIFEKTKAFITGLERDFPSTVNTVSKTATKITTGIKDKRNEPAACKLCRMHFPSGVEEWFHSTTIDSLESSQSAEKPLQVSAFGTDYCYACCILHNRTSID